MKKNLKQELETYQLQLRMIEERFASAETDEDRHFLEYEHARILSKILKCKLMLKLLKK